MNAFGKYSNTFMNTFEIYLYTFMNTLEKYLNTLIPYTKKKRFICKRKLC